MSESSWMLHKFPTLWKIVTKTLQSKFGLVGSPTDRKAPQYSTIPGHSTDCFLFIALCCCSASLAVNTSTSLWFWCVKVSIILSRKRKAKEGRFPCKWWNKEWLSYQISESWIRKRERGGKYWKDNRRNWSGNKEVPNYLVSFFKLSSNNTDKCISLPQGTVTEM